MLTTIYQLAGLVPLAIGLLVIWHVVRPQRVPADRSNRLNKIRLIWFALKREEMFVDQFPWLKKDEFVNMEKKS